MNPGYIMLDYPASQEQPGADVVGGITLDEASTVPGLYAHLQSAIATKKPVIINGFWSDATDPDSGDHYMLAFGPTYVTLLLDSISGLITILGPVMLGSGLSVSEDDLCTPIT